MRVRLPMLVLPVAFAAWQAAPPRLPAVFVPVKGGAFVMGDPFLEGALDERPRHRVTVADFRLLAVEVGWTLWKRVHDWATNHGYVFDNPGQMGAGEFDRRPLVDHDQDPDTPAVPNPALAHPVTGINWWDCVKWCNAWSELEGRRPCYYDGSKHRTVVRAGRPALRNTFVDWRSDGYRLPTEAEWEYAARTGGRPVRFGNGKNVALPAEINFDASPEFRCPWSFPGTPRHRTVPVGSLPAGAAGLHEMSGNVGEWCWDVKAVYPAGAQVDPRGPDEAPGAATGGRVVRGGGFDTVPRLVRVACRYDVRPDLAGPGIGFRVARGGW